MRPLGSQQPEQGMRSSLCILSQFSPSLTGTHHRNHPVPACPSRNPDQHNSSTRSHFRLWNKHRAHSQPQDPDAQYSCRPALLSLLDLSSPNTGNYYPKRGKSQHFQHLGNATSVGRRVQTVTVPAAPRGWQGQGAHGHSPAESRLQRLLLHPLAPCCST